MHISRKFPLFASLIVLALVVSGQGSAAPPTGPAPANGQVVFASDRPSQGIPTPAADGSDARIWVSESPLAAAPGAPVQVTFEAAGVHLQHRNPDWSADHSQIAFVAGAPVGAADPATVPAAIRILDLRTGVQRPFLASLPGQDHPAFSPDGTQVAFIAFGDHLMIKAADAPAAAAGQFLVNDVAGEKPSWTPDGSELYFTRRAAAGREIWKFGPIGGPGIPREERIVAADGSASSDGIDNYDPAVSPDGSALCYSRTVPDRSVPQLAKLDLATGAKSTIITSSDDGTVGGDTHEAAESCAWSPDGTKAIFTATRGFPATRQGPASELHLAVISGGPLTDPALTSLNDVAHFDGSADWAPNLAPQCAAKTADVAAGASVTVALSCLDPDHGAAGQAPASTPVDAASYRIVDAPLGGHIEGGVRPDSSVVFVTDATTSGPVTFTYTASDGTSEGVPATVTVTVTGTNGGGGTGTGTGTGGGTGTPPLKVSALKLSPTTWALGRALPKLLGARAKGPAATRGRLVGGKCVAPTRRNRTARACTRLAVGTTISFRTNQAARVTVGFQRVLSGRRVGGKCVAATTRNRTKARCARFARSQGLAPIDARSGLTRLRFEGRLNRARQLVRGASYRIVLLARDAAGHALPQLNGPRFTIAKRTFTVARKR